MKKIGDYCLNCCLIYAAVVMGSLCALTASADRATPDETKTRVSMPLPEPPVIDGVIDINGGESWLFAGGTLGTGNVWRISVDFINLEDEIRGGFIGDTGDPPIDDSDHSVQIFVGHDDDNLYVAVRVLDDFIETDSAAPGSANEQTWLDDSVEVFVDGDNSNFPDRDPGGDLGRGNDTGGQYVITANNAFREAEAGNPGYGEDSAWFALTSITNDGYDAEFRISREILGSPQQGDIIGFTVASNDDDDGEASERQLVWQGLAHTEITYGNLVIGPRSYTAPKVGTPPVIDGEINVSVEYPGAEEIFINPFTGVYNTNGFDDDFPPDDHSYSAWVVHDEVAVYVAVSIEDDLIVTDTAAAGSEDEQTWLDDSIEIFFDVDDSNNTGAGSFLGEGQYVMTANGAFRDANANDPLFGENDDWFADFTATASGFQVEYKITKFALSDPEDGLTMGFDFAMNDDDGADRESQLLWNGSANSEKNYGDLILSPSGDTALSNWSLY